MLKVLHVPQRDMQVANLPCREKDALANARASENAEKQTSHRPAQRRAGPLNEQVASYQHGSFGLPSVPGNTYLALGYIGDAPRCTDGPHPTQAQVSQVAMATVKWSGQI